MITIIYNDYSIKLKRPINYNKFKTKICQTLFIKEEDLTLATVEYSNGKDRDNMMILAEESDYMDSYKKKAMFFTVELNEMRESGGGNCSIKSNKSEPRFFLPADYNKKILSSISLYKLSFISFLKEKGDNFISKKLKDFYNKNKEKRRKIKEEISTYFSEKLIKESKNRTNIYIQKLNNINNLNNIIQQKQYISQEAKNKREKFDINFGKFSDKTEEYEKMKEELQKKLKEIVQSIEQQLELKQKEKQTIKERIQKQQVEELKKIEDQKRLENDKLSAKFEILNDYEIESNDNILHLKIRVTNTCNKKLPVNVNLKVKNVDNGKEKNQQFNCGLKSKVVSEHYIQVKINDIGIFKSGDYHLNLILRDSNKTPFSNEVDFNFKLTLLNNPDSANRLNMIQNSNSNFNVQSTSNVSNVNAFKGTESQLKNQEQSQQILPSQQEKGELDSFNLLDNDDLNANSNPVKMNDEIQNLRQNLSKNSGNYYKYPVNSSEQRALIESNNNNQNSISQNSNKKYNNMDGGSSGPPINKEEEKNINQIINMVEEKYKLKESFGYEDDGIIQIIEKNNYNIEKIFQECDKIAFEG